MCDEVPDEQTSACDTKETLITKQNHSKTEETSTEISGDFRKKSFYL